MRRLGTSQLSANKMIERSLAFLMRNCLFGLPTQDENNAKPLPFSSIGMGWPFAGHKIDCIPGHLAYDARYGGAITA